MRCRLRTLLILMAVGPPALAGAWHAIPDMAGLFRVAYLAWVAFAVLYEEVPTTSSQKIQMRAKAARPTTNT